MMSSTTATPQTGFWRMAPLLAAQALMTSADLASVLVVNTQSQNLSKHGNRHMNVDYTKRNMMQIKGLG